MGRFDSGNGLCHLVFGNEDVYYTEGLIRLNIRQYLYFELKKLNYGEIYFLSGDEGRCELIVSDTDAAALYHCYEKKSLIGRIFTKKEKTTGAQKFVLDDFKAFWERAIQMMWNEKNLVFVCSISAFSMLKYHPEYVKDLCELAEKNYLRGHLILVQASVAAEGSLPYLADTQGVFHSALFPEIQQIFSLNKNVYIYEQLQQAMGDKAVFLNFLDHPEIYRMVRHFFLKHPEYTQEEGLCAEEITDYIWMYYHSQDFMLQEKNVFPENKKRVLLNIEKSLEDKTRLRRISQSVLRIRNQAESQLPLYKILTERYAFNRWEQLIFEDSAVLRRLYQIPLISLLEGLQNYAAAYMTETFPKIIERLRRPSVMIKEMQVDSFMNQCVDFLQTACGKKDILTAEKAVRALDYITMWRASESIYASMPRQMQEEVMTQQCDYYLKVIYAANQLYTITKLYRQSHSEIEENKKRMRRSMDNVNNFIRMKPWIEEDEHRQKDSHAPVSGEVLLFTQMRREVIMLDKSIKEATYMQAQKRAMMTQCRENIQKMEMAINSIAAGDIYQMKENMAQAAETVKRACYENSSLIREISEESEAASAFMSESAMKQYENAMSDADVQEEFQKIVQAFDEAEKEKVVQVND